jgi:hypothetical protein
MRFGYPVLAAGVVLFAACGTTPEYRTADLSSDQTYKKKGKSSPQLAENEVLGLQAHGSASDSDIRRILDETRSFNLREQSNVLLVQSGAHHPDNEMIQALSKHFTVVPNSGIPSDLRAEEEGDVSKALRLAAAHAKAETIIVYWGKVEMKRDDLPTGLVSWVPVVDFIVPDEYQKVRMHIKVALIDVRTGQWATFRTEPIEDQMLTTRYAREKAPNWPLKSIKERMYQSSVRKLLDGYVMAKN